MNSNDRHDRLPVLVVDDDPVLCAVASKVLERLGLPTRVVHDGQAALDAVAQQRPQLVLLDVEMPSLNGYEVCARLRANPSTEMLPVMIMTGNSDSASIQCAFESGANDLIAKPLNPAILQHRVQFLLRSASAALANDELTIFFQPKVRGSNGQISGCEGLSRWMRDGLACFEPSQFVAVAEESGLIGPLGECALYTACRQFGALSIAPSVRLAVNVSTLQTRDPAFLPMLERVLERTGFDPERLELELTESIFLEPEAGSQETLWMIKDLGVTLALDDFGTGYSSMRYLKTFPIDRIKIDREFVHGIEQNEENQVIVSAIIAMAHRLGMEVTAEGVETREEEAVLISTGCDELQGYLYSQALCGADFERFAASWRPLSPIDWTGEPES